jgi:hypothetical protein
MKYGVCFIIKIFLMRTVYFIHLEYPLVVAWRWDSWPGLFCNYRLFGVRQFRFRFG